MIINVEALYHLTLLLLGVIWYIIRSRAYMRRVKAIIVTGLITKCLTMTKLKVSKQNCKNLLCIMIKTGRSMFQMVKANNGTEILHFTCALKMYTESYLYRVFQAFVALK